MIDFLKTKKKILIEYPENSDLTMKYKFALSKNTWYENCMSYYHVLFLVYNRNAR